MLEAYANRIVKGEDFHEGDRYPQEQDKDTE